MKTKKQRHSPRGRRPSRAQASARALENVNLEKVNPRLILLQIAADTSCPATARVSACRALIGSGPGGQNGAGDDADPVTALALQILRGKNR